MLFGAAALLPLAGLASSARSAGEPAPPPLKAGVFEPPRAAPAMRLEGSDGRPFELARLRGKVVLLEFGFTHCAAVCPITLATLAQARRDLGPAGADVQVVFVTVDPERDDVPTMRNYLGAFDPTFIGATGSPQALEQVRRSLGVQAKRVPMGDSYAVDHTSSVFLIDRAGRLRAMMPYGRPAKDYVHDAGILLAAP
jgi:protein SCO1/2